MFLRSRIVEHLLTNNANASKRDKKGFTAIHYASVKGNKLSIEMVSTPAVYLGRYVKTRLHLQFQVHFYPCGRMRTSKPLTSERFEGMTYHLNNSQWFSRSHPSKGENPRCKFCM